METTAIKWAAQLAGVKEVSLLGTADLEFWRDRLAPQGVIPLERDGRGQVMIIAAEARFHGIRFREVSFSVLARLADGAAGEDGAYLVGAFNSSRFFAFCERFFFSTPYAHGDIRVLCSPPGISLSRSRATLFHAVLRSDVTTPATPGGFDGPVFLPRHGDRLAKFFYARVTGETRTLPAAAAGISIAPTAETPVLRALLDSRFVPTEWQLRHNATHAKSVTYPIEQLHSLQTRLSARIENPKSKI